MKIKYKKLYAEIVEMLAKFSTDKKLKVGGLLLKEGRIVSTGYNGQPNKIPHKEIIQNSHDISTLHAEMNCLVFAAKHGISVNNCEIFVSHFPCVYCTKLLYQAGIKKIYYINDYRNDDNPFKNLIKIEKIK